MQFEHRDWTFVVRTGTIADHEQLERTALEVGFTSLPEMLFAQNTLEIRGPQNVLVRFCAADALKMCALDAPCGADDAPLTPVQVAHASSWSAAVDPAAKSLVFKHDWTYSSLYGGSVARAALSCDGGSGSSAVTIEPSLFNASASASSPEISAFQSPVPVPQPPLHFFADTSAAIRFDLLQPPLPILWASNELVLFEDELHDCGACKLALKVRVMPDCWFVLLRFTLRVDRVMIRVRDVRMFHAFGAQCIVRETQLREHSWSELIAFGLPDDPAFFAAHLERVVDRVPACSKRVESLQLQAPLEH